MRVLPIARQVLIPENKHIRYASRPQAEHYEFPEELLTACWPVVHNSTIMNCMYTVKHLFQLKQAVYNNETTEIQRSSANVSNITYRTSMSPTHV